jgi:hypothetical protein
MDLTADTITNAHILALKTELLQRKRLNAYARAILRDCDGALKGSLACRESCAMAWNKRRDDPSLEVGTAEQRKHDAYGRWQRGSRAQDPDRKTAFEVGCFCHYLEGDFHHDATCDAGAAAITGQKTSPPKVTFSVSTVVAVRIRGEGGDGYYIPDDGGLVGRFQKWCLEEEIHSAIRAGFSGGGGLLGFYFPDDANKIFTWLTSNGATEDDEYARIDGGWVT